MDRVLACIRETSPKKAVVVGAGFVGLEVVEQLARLGQQVTLIERGDHVLKPLDDEMATMVENELARHQVSMALGAGVERLVMDDGRAVAVELSGGQRIDCDMIIVGAGVRSRVELAQAAGLTIGKSGGVSVNEFMQTSDPLIYAVGDMTEVPHGVLNKPQRIPLQGRPIALGVLQVHMRPRGTARLLVKCWARQLYECLTWSRLPLGSTNAHVLPTTSTTTWPRSKPTIMLVTIQVLKS